MIHDHPPYPRGIFFCWQEEETTMKKSKQLLSLSLTIILLICVLATTGFAANGEPLKLESSNPENGALDVATDLEEIELFFSKNVVNMKVEENNRTCINFVDGDGNPVAFELRMEDDQVNREFRDYIYVRPAETLKEGTTYTVIISKELTSKSGTAMEDDVEVSFTTVGGSSTTTDTSAGSGNNPALIPAALAAIVVIGFFLVRRNRK